LAYDGDPPRAGLALTATVIETKQPAVKPNAPAQVKVERGQAKTVPVLEGVFDPWAEDRPAQLRSVTVSGDATAVAAGQSITVTAHSAQAGGQVTVGFVVQDGMGRSQAGSFAVIARDVPRPPASVTAVPSSRGEARISWAPVTGSNANGEPVDSYRVVLAGADCDQPTSGAVSVRCRTGGLAPGSRHRVEVYARNAVGESPGPGVGFLDYEFVPDPPVAGQAVAGKNRIDLAWEAPGVGEADHYTVVCNGVVVGAKVQAARLTVSDLAAGVSQACSVSAVNSKGASAAAHFGAVTPYGDPGRPGAPRVSWLDESSVEVAWDPVAETGAAVSYTLLVNDAAQPGCAATSCVVALESGSVAKFQVRATSEKADAISKLSDAAGPFRQPPGVLAAVAAPSLTRSNGSAAGAAAVSVAWPSHSVPSGFDAAVERYFDGGLTSGPATAFSGLRAGTHTAKLRYCLVSAQGVPLVPGWPPDRLCATSPAAEVQVTTRPSGPENCAVARTDQAVVSVSCSGPADPGGLATWWKVSLDGSARPDQASGVFILAVPSTGAGHLEVAVANELGASPGVRLDYPAWNKPLGELWTTNRLLTSPVSSPRYTEPSRASSSARPMPWG
jgi:hypothetical protein